MKQFVWSVAALVCIGSLITISECRSLSKRDTYHLDPNMEKLTDHSIYRDKRKIEVVTGVKNAVLGFVFNPKNTQFSWERPKTTTTPKGPTTTEDIVIFEPGEKVSLEIPDPLVGTGFTLVTNLSRTVGDYMINSAFRAHRLLESMRPFLRGIFGSKGIVIEATTDKPIFSDPNME